MISIAVEWIEAYIETIPEQVNGLAEESMVRSRAPGKWSNLQILGHLCDSALHNLNRFIQVQLMPEPLRIIPYDQDRWVLAQGYQTAAIGDIVTLWVSLNRSIVRVIASLPEETLLSRTVILSNGEVQTLAWLIQDYAEHMKHHLEQIFPGGEGEFAAD